MNRLLHARRRSLTARSLRTRRLLFDRLEDRTLLATITVTNLANSGAGSLNDAIDAANVDSTPDLINFSVSGTISPTTALPPITTPVTIDGTGQQVTLDGSAAGFAAGLTISGAGGSGSAIRGLAIDHFFFGIVVQSSATGAVIDQNFIGTDYGAHAAAGNSIGIALLLGAANTQITGNVVSGNSIAGIAVGAQSFVAEGQQVIGTQILGNYIGTNAAGAGLPNGTATTNGDGTKSTGNSAGILMNSPDTTQIGGVGSGQGNVIAFNNGPAISLGSAGTGPHIASRNSIRGNSIYANLGFLNHSVGTGLAVELNSGGADGQPLPNDSGDGDGGTNAQQNYPELWGATGGSSTQVVGQLNSTADTNFQIDFYVNDTNLREGKVYLGSTSGTANHAGDLAFNFTSSVATADGQYITATATDASGNSSEFSGPLAVQVPPANQPASGAVAAADSAAAQAIVAAVNALPSQAASPVTITVNLAAGTYEGITASPPPGVTLVLNGSGGGTFVGHSPALTVTSGTVVVTGLNFTNSTDAPTILVTGGTLQMRSSTVHETTGGNRAALEITGGSVDLGTADDPGGNTLDTTGPGSLIRNPNYAPLTAIGNTYFVNGIQQTDGDVDPSFGDGGSTNIRLLAPSGREDLLCVGADEATGKILVVGRAYGTIAALFLTRYNSDGTLDTAFGKQGYVQLPLDVPASLTKAAIEPATGTAPMKVVLYGSLSNSGTGQDFGLARFNLDGTPDTSFGNLGIVATDFSGGSDLVHSVVFHNGVIYAVGEASQAGTGKDFAIASYLDNGSLNPTFHASGKLTTNLGGATDIANCAVFDNGQLVVGGESDRAGLGRQFAAARYDAVSGDLDTSLNGVGYLAYTIPNHPIHRATDIATPNGKILLFDSSQGVSGGGWTIRFNADGTLDTGYGGDFVHAAPIGTTYKEGGGDSTAAQAWLADDTGELFFRSGSNTGAFFRVDGDGHSPAVAIAGPGFVKNVNFEGFTLTRVGANYIAGGLRNGHIILERFSWVGDMQDSSFGASGETIPPAAYAPNWRSVGRRIDVVNTPKGDKTLVLLLSGTICRLNQDGSLDKTFGDEFTHSLRAGSVIDLAVADDRIYVLINSGGSLFVSRYTAAGRLDATFGNGGTANAHVPAPTILDNSWDDVLLPTSQRTPGAHLAVTPQGVVVATTNYRIEGSSFNWSVLLTRLRADNQQVDPTFGSNGVVSMLQDVELQPGDGVFFGGTYYPELRELLVRDGNILLTTELYGVPVAYKYSATELAATVFSSFDSAGSLLWQRNENGQPFAGLPLLDPETVNSQGAAPNRPGTLDFHVKAMALQGNQTVVAGEAYSKQGDMTVLLRRYNFDGSLDHSFGDNGDVQLYGVPDYLEVYAAFVSGLASGPDGKLLVSIGVNDSSTALLYRLNANGAVDSGFGDNGVVVYPLQNLFTGPVRIAVDSSGYPFTLSLPANGTLTPAVTRLLGSSSPVVPTQSAFIAGSSDVLFNEAAEVTVGASDPDQLVAAAGFSYVVDWGDGSAPTAVARTAHNGSGLDVTHTFNAVGSFQVQVTATNANHVVSTSSLTIHSGYTVLRRGALFVTGTSGNDTIDLTEDGGLLTIQVNGHNGGSFATADVTDDAYIQLQGADTVSSNWGGTVLGTDGADSITVNAMGSAGFHLLAGDGDDSLVIRTYGSSSAQVRGGAGNDVLDVISNDDSGLDIQGEAGDDTISIVCNDRSGGGGGDGSLGGGGEDHYIISTSGSSRFELNALLGNASITYSGSGDSSASLGGSDGGTNTITVNSTGSGGVTVGTERSTAAITVKLGQLAGTVALSNAYPWEDVDLTPDSLQVLGTPGDDTIHKTPGLITFGSPVTESITYVGQLAALTIDGGAGNDTITDPGQNTTILGGLGNDTIIVNTTTGSGIFVDGGPGSDTYVIGGGQFGDLVGPVTVADSGASGTDTVTVLGTSGNDAIAQTNSGFSLNGTLIVVSGLEGASVKGGGGVDQIIATGTPPVPVQVQNVTDMVVVGTSGNDQISFDPGSQAGEIVARRNGVVVSRFSPTGKIVAYGGAGDDNIQVASSISLPAWLYGEAGNDRLNAGNGGGLLIGGDGNDELLGGNGRDVMVGGQGADKLTGNAADDILIAGLTRHDDRALADHEAFWQAVLAEWNSQRTFAARVVNLKSGGAAYSGPLLLPDVVDDCFGDEVDVLNGAAGNDWLIFLLGEDKVNGQAEAAN